VWVGKLVSNIKGRIRIEGVQVKDAGEYLDLKG
jgi:hypothetical protein